MAKQAIFVIPEAPAPAHDGNRLLTQKQANKIRLGVLDNSKGNADHLLTMLVERVEAAIPLASVLRLRKPTAGLSAPDAMLDQLARESDCVVTAMAD